MSHVRGPNETGNKLHRPFFSEIWVIEVGIEVKNYLSVDFKILGFLHTLICLLLSMCNFPLIFKRFPQKVFYIL